MVKVVIAQLCGISSDSAAAWKKVDIVEHDGRSRHGTAVLKKLSYWSIMEKAVIAQQGE